MFPILHLNTIPYVCGGGEPVVAVAAVVAIVAIVVASALSNIHCGTLTSTRSVSLRSSVGERVVSVEGETASIFGASVKESVLGASVDKSAPGVIVVSVVITVVVGDGGIVVVAVDVDVED